jgi:hypothetical protein
MVPVATAKRTAAKQKQPTLTGYKPTALESASRDLLVAREDLEAAKKNVENKGLTMIEVMKREGRTSLTVEGYTISVDVTPSREKLKVKKAEMK